MTRGVRGKVWEVPPRGEEREEVSHGDLDGGCGCRARGLVGSCGSSFLVLVLGSWLKWQPLGSGSEMISFFLSRCRRFIHYGMSCNVKRGFFGFFSGMVFFFEGEQKYQNIKIRD